MVPLKTLLKNAGEARKWSLQEAADAIGITKAHLHSMESGSSDNPTLRVVAALVIVYGLRPESLIASVLAPEYQTEHTVASEQSKQEPKK